ncbi:MAG: hypothetical protein OXI80_01220 [Caldilineaceae bacterium]|nr:hypothetical protein [Caldilineaceae bacterium]MDE0336263.1 hypothetical protein [Caldilineaceae bacterium]
MGHIVISGQQCGKQQQSKPEEQQTKGGLSPPPNGYRNATPEKERFPQIQHGPTREIVPPIRVSADAKGKKMLPSIYEKGVKKISNTHIRLKN